MCGVVAGACDWKDGDKRKNELPPAFKKKLAEWEIRKAVAGKSDQNVEDLQKILPHDFNRKLQEWERIKAAKPAAGATAGAGNSIFFLFIEFMEILIEFYNFSLIN